MRSTRITDVYSVLRAPKAPAHILHITSRASSKCSNHCQDRAQTSAESVIYLSQQQEKGGEAIGMNQTGLSIKPSLTT